MPKHPKKKSWQNGWLVHRTVCSMPSTINSTCICVAHVLRHTVKGNVLNKGHWFICQPSYFNLLCLMFIGYNDRNCFFNNVPTYLWSLMWRVWRIKIPDQCSREWIVFSSLYICNDKRKYRTNSAKLEMKGNVAYLQGHVIFKDEL